MDFGSRSQPDFKFNLSEFTDEFEELQKLSNDVFDEISDGFISAIKSGKSFEDTLSQITKGLADIALNFAAEKISDGLSGLFDNLLSSTLDLGSNTSQNFLSGLGPANSPVSGSARTSPVNVTIQTPDALSFQNSEQMVSALMARAVQRGQRNL